MARLARAMRGVLLLAGVHSMHGLPSFTATSSTYSHTTDASSIMAPPSMVQGYWEVDLSRCARPQHRELAGSRLFDGAVIHQTARIARTLSSVTKQCGHLATRLGPLQHGSHRWTDYFLTPSTPGQNNGRQWYNANPAKTSYLQNGQLILPILPISSHAVSASGPLPLQRDHLTSSLQAF